MIGGMQIGEGQIAGEGREIMLGDFHSVFEMPLGLPPRRIREHPIVLKEGSNPVGVWPYATHNFRRMRLNS